MYTDTRESLLVNNEDPTQGVRAVEFLWGCAHR